MARSQTLYIFHIARHDWRRQLAGDEADILHPFGDRAQILHILDKCSVQGLFGAEPDMARISSLRLHLYTLLDGAVRQWMGDIRFLPRFLISTLAFLIVYFSLTLFIATSMSVGTALYVSLLVAALVYLVMNRSDLRSDVALKRRISLQSRIDTIVFRESEFIHRIEDKLAAYDSMDTEDLLSRIDLSGSSFMDDFPQEAFQLYQYLKRRFARYDFVDSITSRLPMFLERSKNGNIAVATLDANNRKRKLLLTKKIDIPLYALYVGLRTEINANR